MATASLSRYSARLASPGARSRRLTELLVFGIALASRLVVPVFGGGFHGNYPYDSGVYYAAGMGVMHGQIPYLDFVLVHPPLIAVATAPFAALGMITTDQTGFIAANLAFTALGACNAVLVLWLARRLGFDRTAAVAAALFYAVWRGAVSAEYEIRLEPLGNTLLLLALLALLAGTRRDGNSRLLLVAGVLLGLAVNVKIWWAAPAVVVVGWALAHGVRRAAPIVAGGAAVLLLLDLPMLLLTKGNMWAMVVTSQLDRPQGPHPRPLAERLWSLAGVLYIPVDWRTVTLGALVLLALAGLLVAASSLPACRLVLLIGVVQVAVLALGPVWNAYYPDYLAVVLSVAIAGGVVRLRTGPVLRHFALPLAAVVLVSSSALMMMRLASTSQPVEPERHQARLSAAVAGASCVLSDSPMALIATNTLHVSFGPDCRNWVDVGGMEGANALGSRLVDPTIRPGLANYLTSSGTVLLDRHDSLVTHLLASQVRAVVPLVPVGRYLVSRPRVGD